MRDKKPLEHFPRAMQDADEAGRRRIAKTLAGMRVGDMGRYWQYEAVGNDKKLKTFVFIASMLMEHGKMSLRQMAGYVESQRMAGSEKYRDVSLSHGTLVSHLGDVQDILGCKLVDNSEGKAGNLTESGIQHYHEIVRYLELKSAQRGSPISD